MERSRSEDRVKWDWRHIFKKVAPGLATALEAKLDHSLGASLSQEASAWAKDQKLHELPVDFVHVSDGLDHPRKVSKVIIFINHFRVASSENRVYWLALVVHPRDEDNIISLLL